MKLNLVALLVLANAANLADDHVIKLDDSKRELFAELQEEDRIRTRQAMAGLFCGGGLLVVIAFIALLISKFPTIH